MTLSWFRRELRYRPGLELATGYDVAVVARKLRAPTVVYGPLLASKVRGFQMLRGLPADGVVDLWTAKQLGEVNLSVPDWYSDEMNSEQLQIAQLLLGVEPDGAIGPDMEAAVRRFQSARDLPVTGVIDAETAKWMGEL